jgi:hypothetical protein
VAQPVVLEAAVAVTSQSLLIGVVTLFTVASQSVIAGVLPEDRADILYHSYNGGGVEVTGPALLIRKGDNRRFSVSAKYYVDSISSASVDVISQGSEYTEQRVEKSIGVDYLNADTIMSFNYSNSDESDYQADTFSFDVSHSMFGDLTTVSLGYSKGFDEVSSNLDPNRGGDANHQKYRVSLTQILTKKLIAGINYEAVVDSGFLNNPYRSVRYLDTPTTTATQLEVYPNTRSSNAISGQLKYYLPYRAAVGGKYRFYVDDWDITANTIEFNYVHPLGEKWTFEVLYRLYEQTGADFYSDLFPRQDAQNFLARDKELSDFRTRSFELGFRYEFLSKGWHFIDKAAINMKFRRILFNYNDFTDITRGNKLPGEEDFYSFSANVYQIFLSAWF